MCQYILNIQLGVVSGVQVRCCDSGSGATQTAAGARDSGHGARGNILQSGDQNVLIVTLCSVFIHVDLFLVALIYAFNLKCMSRIYPRDTRFSRRNTERESSESAV